jgi:hypothetical protein
LTRAAISVGLGLAVGLGCGWACQHWLAKRPLLQSITSVVSAWLLASIVSGVLWLFDPPADADILAVTFGITEAALSTAVIVVVAAGLHAGSKWIGGPPPIVTWRPLILGAIGGVYGAATVAYELGLVRPFH